MIGVVRMSSIKMGVATWSSVGGGERVNSRTRGVVMWKKETNKRYVLCLLVVVVVSDS